MMEDCLFCKLISKASLQESRASLRENRVIPPKFIYETDTVVAFHDIHPKADIHVLIVPKKHIPGFLDIKEIDSDLIFDMIRVIQKLTKETNSDKIGYRISINGGKYQEVPHLHWHLLGDRN